MNTKETGLRDVDDVMVLNGDTLGYKNGEYKVGFKNYSWVLLTPGGRVHTYFKDIRQKVSIIRRGLDD